MLEKVAAIIREQLNQENVEITEATRFKEDLEVDSLDLFELVMAFEEEYGVSIPSEELENMATVGAVSYTHLLRNEIVANVIAYFSII